MPSNKYTIDTLRRLVYIMGMFVRVKTTKNSPRKSVQIVMSVRKGNQIIQKIVRHVGIAHDDMELSQLKLLAESIKIKLEAGNQRLLFSPEEIAKETIKAKKTHLCEFEDDYQVNLKNIKEEQRVIYPVGFNTPELCSVMRVQGSTLGFIPLIFFQGINPSIFIFF